MTVASRATDGTGKRRCAAPLAQSLRQHEGGCEQHRARIGNALAGERVGGAVCGTEDARCVGASRPHATVLESARLAATSAAVRESSGAQTTTSKRSGVKIRGRIASCGCSRSISSPSCCCSSRAASASQLSSTPTSVIRPRLSHASAKARASVHSHESAPSGARMESSARPSYRTRTIEVRRSRSASSDLRAASLFAATSTASAPSSALREESGNERPKRVNASAPNGTCRSSTWNPCWSETAVSARLASAITSGPIPCRARQTTV